MKKGTEAVSDHFVQLLLDDEQKRSALVSYLEGCYREPNRDLAAFVKPFLAREQHIILIQRFENP